MIADRRTLIKLFKIFLQPKNLILSKLHYYTIDMLHLRSIRNIVNVSHYKKTTVFYNHVINIIIHTYPWNLIKNTCTLPASFSNIFMICGVLRKRKGVSIECHGYRFKLF